MLGIINSRGNFLAYFYPEGRFFLTQDSMHNKNHRIEFNTLQVKSILFKNLP